MRVPRHSGLAVCLAAALAAAGLAATGAGSTAPVPVPVRGIEGIKGPKLVNLEKALQLQHRPPPPPAHANVAPLVRGPNGPPVPDQPPIKDDRDLLNEIPPDVIGGS